MAYTYEHNTAHQLRPVKGFDLVSYMDFVAPIASTVHGVMPGTVMHRDTTSGELKTGLEAQSMAMFMLSKQDSEDVINNPGSTAANFTSISMNSYGGFNTAPYNDESNPHTVGEGLTTLFGGETGLYGGATPTIACSNQKSAYTVLPGVCGLELASSEFAYLVGNTTTQVSYPVDQPLTSPVAVADADNAADGTPDQQKQGGFLKPGTLYKDNICGIVSHGPALNENRTRMLRFWAIYMPAMPADSVADVITGNAAAVTSVANAVATEITTTTGTGQKYLQYDATDGITYAVAP